MFFTPKPSGKSSLPRELLKKDLKESRRFGPCAIGEAALYLNSFFISRRYYVPVSSVCRIYKRIAMSRGGFSGKGIFATIPYLVVVYDDDREKVCNFKFEEKVDQFIRYFHEKYPQIPIYSQEGEKRLAEKARQQEAKLARIAHSPASAQIRQLQQACDYLEEKPAYAAALSEKARRKRAFEISNPAYRWVALFITILGAASLVYGVYALLQHSGFSVYFLLFGLAALFLFSGARVLPTRQNNRKRIDAAYAQAVEEMARYISRCPAFPLPARYAHPAVLRWMIDILAEGRATDNAQALEVLKADLKALNATVTVDQEVYDDIIQMKPLFLVCGYE